MRTDRRSRQLHALGSVRLRGPQAAGGAHRSRRPSRLLAAFLLVSYAAAAGCYHYKVHVPQPNPETEWKAKTVHSLFWGLVQENAPADDCADNVIDQVRVTTNFGFVLLTVISLGIWSPMRVAWRCANLEPPVGDIPGGSPANH